MKTSSKIIFKLFLLSLCFIIESRISLAQTNPLSKYANNWYFGDKAGLNFSTGTPTIIMNSSMLMKETGSTISDFNGNLLFYTNGDTIWNKNHQIMLNGIGLLNSMSASQGGLIIKKPGLNNEYYVFSNDDSGGSDGVRYHIVDMDADNGNGVVVSKNNLLYAPSTEKLAATFHCNKKDVWVLGQVRNSNTFCAYLLTESGISTSPVNSTLGYFHNDDASAVLTIPGAMKFSPNGEKIGLAYTIYPVGISELFDFDSQTGMVSNHLFLSTDSLPYGVSFSPDNSKLYFQSLGTSVWSKIIQYDLSVSNQSLIPSSRNIVFEEYLLSGELTSLQLASNNKIYGARYDTDTLLVINNPNSYGLSCNVSANSVFLNGRKCYENLPHFNESYFSAPSSTNCLPNNYTSLSNIESELEIYPTITSNCFTVYNKSLIHACKVEIEIFNSFGELLFKEKNDLNLDGKAVLCPNFNNEGLYYIKANKVNVYKILYIKN